MCVPFHVIFTLWISGCGSPSNIVLFYLPQCEYLNEKIPLIRFWDIFCCHCLLLHNPASFILNWLTEDMLHTYYFRLCARDPIITVLMLAVNEELNIDSSRFIKNFAARSWTWKCSVLTRDKFFNFVNGPCKMNHEDKIKHRKLFIM